MSSSASIDLAALGELSVTDPKTGSQVTVKSLWAESPVLLHLLRRFGCQLCRHSSLELSAIKPQLDELRVRMVGVGVEQLGYAEFAEGRFWNGEVYVDEGKKLYGVLGYPKKNFLVGLLSLFTSDVRKAISASKQAGVTGNFKGDGMQLGGTLVVDQGGSRVLYHKAQEHFGDAASPVAILEALGYAEKTGKPVPHVFVGKAPKDCGCEAKE